MAVNDIVDYTTDAGVVVPAIVRKQYDGSDVEIADNVAIGTAAKADLWVIGPNGTITVKGLVEGAASPVAGQFDNDTNTNVSG